MAANSEPFTTAAPAPARRYPVVYWSGAIVAGILAFTLFAPDGSAPSVSGSAAPASEGQSAQDPMAAVIRRLVTTQPDVTPADTARIAPEPHTPAPRIAEIVVPVQQANLSLARISSWLAPAAGPQRAQPKTAAVEPAPLLEPAAGPSRVEATALGIVAQAIQPAHAAAAAMPPRPNTSDSPPAAAAGTVAQVAFAPPPAASVGPIRLFLHYAARPASERQRAVRLAEELRRRGLTVAAIRAVPQTPRNAVVRFYHKADREHARVLTSALAAAAPGAGTPSQWALSDFTRYRAPPRAGNLEIWIPD